MTPDRKLHGVEQTLDEDDFKTQYAFWHLLKLYEILDVVAAGGQLPNLQRIDLQLHTLCWAEDYTTKITSNIKDNMIWVDWSDVAIEFHHKLYTQT